MYAYTVIFTAIVHQVLSKQVTFSQLEMMTMQEG